MRVSTMLLTMSSALLLAGGGPVAAAKPAKPVKAKLECKIPFAPGAAGVVRYEVDGPRKRFQAAVEVAEAEQEDRAAAVAFADVPLYAAGDVLPVSIGTTPAYAVGKITLRLVEDQLEGALKLETRGRGRGVFPPDFPNLTAGTPVTIDGRSCTLQERRRPR
jgi:hypothetical protein